jgi:S-DNA-T family DNA segregation ATPase FtsK/SpoIIIE
MKNSPATLRLILLDPKKVELIHFDGIPHLIGPVETEPKRMVAALQWAVGEMDRRFKLLEDVNARDLDSYNQKMFKRNLEGLSRIVIVIDELADLMLLAAEQTEISIARLAQMARATGIHLIVSTQRPSTNIVTGLIKSNFPARLAFMTASQMDSRVILDTSGAENLLGKGDMLFLNPEASGLQRAQAPKVEDGEIEKLVAFWKGQYPSVNTEAPWEGMALKVPDNEYSDNLFEKAIQVIQQEGKASASLLQRRLNIGYPRAARLIDELEKTGYVGPAEVGGKERSVNFPHNDDQEEPGNY